MDTLLFVLPFQQQDDRPYTDHAEIRSTSTSLPGSVQLPCKSECSVPFTRTEASYTVLSPSESSADCESKISISKTITLSTCIYFQCRCDSQHRCTYQDFINGKCSGHPRDIFPYLNAEGLSSSEKCQLTNRLCDDTKDIMEEFALAVIGIFTILDDKQVSVKAIRMQVTAFSVGFPGPKKSDVAFRDLHNAKNVQDIGARLIQHKFISFINYRILEQIVRQFEENLQDKILSDLLSNYLRSFEAFCKRSVFEVPADIFEDNSPESDTKFVVKVSEEYFSNKALADHETTSKKIFDFTLQDLDDVRRDIQKIIGNSDSIAFVCGVAKGCVEITFCILSTVEVLPFSNENIRQISQIGVKVIKQYHKTAPIGHNKKPYHPTVSDKGAESSTDNVISSDGFRQGCRKLHR